jgi:hypothetical protein
LNQRVRPVGSAEFSDDALPVCLGAVVDQRYENAINVEDAQIDERRPPSGGLGGVGLRLPRPAGSKPRR